MCGRRESPRSDIRATQFIAQPRDQHKSASGEMRWEATVHFACQRCRRAEQGNWRVPSYHPKKEQPFICHAYQFVHGVTVLTLQEPYAWLVAEGFKDMENRKWHSNFSGRVFIHSAKTFSQNYAAVDNWAGTHMGVILPEREQLAQTQGRIVAVAEFGPMVLEHNSPWKMDNHWAWPIKWCHPINATEPQPRNARPLAAPQRQHCHDLPADMTVKITEEDRQLICLALAVLSIQRPGYEAACETAAANLYGGLMFKQFRHYNAKPNQTPDAAAGEGGKPIQPGSESVAPSPGE